MEIIKFILTSRNILHDPQWVPQWVIVRSGMCFNCAIVEIDLFLIRSIDHEIAYIHILSMTSKAELISDVLFYAHSINWEKFHSHHIFF